MLHNQTDNLFSKYCDGTFQNNNNNNNNLMPDYLYRKDHRIARLYYSDTTTIIVNH